jgi:hypothetical protein
VVLKNVPVNYAIRFSDSVTALTARRVRHGVGPDFICQPGPAPGEQGEQDRQVRIDDIARKSS